jgi:hypothetical protein
MTNWPGLIVVTSKPSSLDHANVLVGHRGRLSNGLDAAVVPQVRPARADGGHPDDRVGQLLGLRVGTVLEAGVDGSVDDCSALEKCSFCWAYRNWGMPISSEPLYPPGPTTRLASRTAESSPGPASRRHRQVLEVDA